MDVSRIESFILIALQYDFNNQPSLSHSKLQELKKDMKLIQDLKI